jgi:hypothetical protein
MILKSTLADLSFIQYTIIDFMIDKRGIPKNLRSFGWPDLRKKPSVLESLKFFQVCFCPFLFVRAAHTSLIAKNNSKLHSTTMMRHVTCFVEKAWIEARTLGTKAERYDHCATRPVLAS